MKTLPRILFVDQDIIYCGVLALFLKKNSLNAGACVDHNYEAIHTLFAEGLPDIVVVSFKSTQPATIETAIWIKKHYPSVKIVISTQHLTSTTTQVICSKAAAQGIIIKTIHSPQQIVAILHTVFNSEQQFYTPTKLP